MSENEVDWERYAQQYDSITMGGSNPAYLELVDKVVGYFTSKGLAPGSLFADLCGGTGNFSLPLAKRFPDSQFVIIDTSETMLEKAREKAQSQSIGNLEYRLKDVESLGDVAEEYRNTFDDVIMIHGLYATSSRQDPQKPQRILREIYTHMSDGEDSTFFISDINRKIRTNEWVPYCLFNAFRKEKSIIKTVRFFVENDQAKRANHYIDEKQKNGDFLLCDLDQLVGMIRDAGFSQILEVSDTYYRGRDNLVVAKK